MLEVEIKKIDVRDIILKEYVTADEVRLLYSEDYYALITGRLKTETKVYNEKPREELFLEIEYKGSKRRTWLKLTNPILVELGMKLGNDSDNWAGHTLFMKLDKWNSREVVRVEVVE